MKVTVLAENTACREDMFPQHGLSLLLDTGDQKILFDMGQDDTFIRNAISLGIDLSEVDLVILSHGHYDHGGGLEALLRINSKAAVYVHECAFGNYYNAAEKYIGLNKNLREHPRLRFIKGSCRISAALHITDCNDRNWHSQPWGLSRREGDTRLPDDFRHEQYLEITEGDKRILISGCSHKGIVSIAGYFRPDVLIGGFHLNKLENEEELKAIARRLLSGNTRYYTGHCTGEKQFTVLKESMGDRLLRIATGYTFEV